MKCFDCHQAALEILPGTSRSSSSSFVVEIFREEVKKNRIFRGHVGYSNSKHLKKTITLITVYRMGVKIVDNINILLLLLSVVRLNPV